MTATLTIEGKEFGRKSPTHSKQINFPPQLNDSNDITMRDLLAHVVREEVAEFEQRQKAHTLFRVLTAEQIETGAAKGKIDPSPREAQHANVERAITTALQAFEDGHVFAFVDRKQRESLDEIVTILPDSTLTFIRLVPLVGG